MTDFAVYISGIGSSNIADSMCETYRQTTHEALAGNGNAGHLSKNPCTILETPRRGERPSRLHMRLTRMLNHRTCHHLSAHIFRLIVQQGRTFATARTLDEQATRAPCIFSACRAISHVRLVLLHAADGRFVVARSTTDSIERGVARARQAFLKLYCNQYIHLGIVQYYCKFLF